MQKATVLALGVVLTVLGLFLFVTAYTSYHSCLGSEFSTYCSQTVVPLGIPLQIIGGTMTAVGLGSIVVGTLESRKPTSSS